MEGDRCEVVMQVVNPSAYELRITNMQLLTEDVEFEPETTSVVLPPTVDPKTTAPTLVTLSGNAFFNKFFFFFFPPFLFCLLHFSPSSL